LRCIDVDDPSLMTFPIAHSDLLLVISLCHSYVYEQYAGVSLFESLLYSLIESRRFGFTPLPGRRLSAIFFFFFFF
jgi:hypothetical protein